MSAQSNETVVDATLRTNGNAILLTAGTMIITVSSLLGAVSYFEGAKSAPVMATMLTVVGLAIFIIPMVSLFSKRLTG
jgi:hypothetical protein